MVKFDWSTILRVFLVASTTGHLLVGSNDNGCLGLLPLPCVCSPANVSTRIECLNAELEDADMDYLVVVGSGHMHALRWVTFTGNKFTRLPAYAFGSYVENVQALEILNLSSNSFANISREAFCGMENLKKLDLSNNKIILTSDDQSDLSIFNAVSKSLTYLKLTSFFGKPLDANLQTLRLKKSFELAQFKTLHFLDLASNDLDFLPYDFLCSLQELRNFYLSDNFLSTLFLNPRCYTNLKTLDLSRNRFKQLHPEFRLTVQGLRADFAVRAQGNLFECNCNSTDYLEWISKNAAKFHNAEALQCYKASPKQFAQKSIIDWVVFHLDSLDCQTPVSGGSSMNVEICVNLIFGFCLTAMYFS